MNGFGCSYIAREGGAMHPDDVHWDADYFMSDELYVKQGRAYLKDTGDNPDAIYWSRPHLLDLIKGV